MTLIAGREVRERLSSRAFLLATMALLLGVATLVVGPTLLDHGATTIRVGVARGVPLPEPAAGLDVVAAGSPADSTSALRAGRLDILLEADEVMVRGEGTSPETRAAAEQLASEAGLRLRLQHVGLGPAATSEVLHRGPIPVRDAVPQPADQSQRTTAASVATITLYGALLTYGSWVGMGIATEKENRVAEVMLTTVRPGQYLAGKLAGIGSVALGQLTMVGVVAAIASAAVGHPPTVLSAAAGWGLLWFLLGFGLYSCAFAAVGAAVSRPEDAQSALGPLTLLLTAAYGAGMAIAAGATGWWTTAASLFPPLAPLTMPVRLLTEDVPPGQVAASILACAAASYLCIRVGTRAFSGALRRPQRPHDDRPMRPRPSGARPDHRLTMTGTRSAP